MNKEQQADSKGNAFDVKVFKQLMAFVMPYKGIFFLLVFISLSMAVLAPVLPVLISKTIEEYISMGDEQGLLNMTILMVVVLAGQSLLAFFNTYLSGWLGQTVIKDIRVKLYRHILNLRLSFFDKTPIGRLVTRNVSDIETLSEVFSQGVASILADLLQLVAILGVMLWWNWRLTLVSLSTLPVLLISTYIFKEKIKDSFGAVRTAVSNLNTFVQEHVTGMSIVQIFGTEDRELKKFKEINEEHRRAHLRSVKYYSIYFPVADVIGAVGIGLLVWYGAKGIFAGWVDNVGVLIAFIMFIGMFLRPIRMIADRFNTLQMGLISTERIMRLLDSDEMVQDQGSFEPDTLKGEITFEDVYFAYKDEDYVLKDLSFKVGQGQTVAFVGATGAGKSSTIGLLNRFYQPQKGRVLIDGVEISEYSLPALRRHVGLVLQDVFLFSDSILENIRLGNPDITEEMVWKASEQVGAKGFIERLPNKLHYQVQERGMTLSVGQRQLISFVRAMVYDPKILILDEATSSVDSETEQMIQNAIERMMEGRTAVVIAHRLATIQKADKIGVLDKGELKEMGSHQELLQQDGYYRQLYQMQYKNS